MAVTIPHPTTDTAPFGPVRCVFVYGTLRRGEQRDINLLLPTPIFIGNGHIPGVLYDLGTYPGIRLGGNCRVHGEVYQISPEVERQLDAIEEVWPQQTGEYTRQETLVELSVASAGETSGLHQSCLVYEVSERRAAGMPVMVSGDWVSG